jgi:hypothetical protein
MLVMICMLNNVIIEYCCLYTAFYTALHVYYASICSCSLCAIALGGGVYILHDSITGTIVLYITLLSAYIYYDFLLYAIVCIVV